MHLISNTHNPKHIAWAQIEKKGVKVLILLFKFSWHLSIREGHVLVEICWKYIKVLEIIKNLHILPNTSDLKAQKGNVFGLLCVMVS